MGMDDTEVIQLLLDDTNRTIVAQLNESARELTVDELAERIVGENVLALHATEYENRFEETVISLHHSRLPRLAEAGLIEYDAAENIVSYGNYTTLNPDWEEIGAIDELLSRFRTESPADTESIGVLEGRDAVYEYGRELADRADDELFLIYTSDELLHEECLPHAKAAIDRGVSFAAGAKSEGTRQFFRESLPEATVWDPQLDWMNNPDDLPKISRLIFADRDKVLVGLWKEADGDNSNEEIAMIGEGARNPLVVLVRELLGPRLDHLDYQSETFMTDLPFEP
ncbi:DUF7344 domain-containing protein [Haloarcula nitratireducens]|uniref:DUF7344 domain-containing protein n=1 Tax=Haloarcula nitratireducens TaxID=2487749 RepID=A0AAW4PLV2_9EURY|nr:hypothetical protein [Halomicroarcula nitratireducens]MBX0298265.1 hypothetical protein [Halomicroarcula nitratireducens]